MALMNKVFGAPIYFSIGQKGQMPDVRAARITSNIVLSMTPKGPVETATIIEVHESRAGETYTKPRLANLFFASDRTERVELLDGTADAPKSVQALVADQMAKLATWQAANLQAAPAELSIADLTD